MARGPEIGSRIDEEVPQVGQNARMGRMSTLIVALAVAAAVVGCARGLPTLDARATDGASAAGGYVLAAGHTSVARRRRTLFQMNHPSATDAAPSTMYCSVAA